MRLSPSPQLRQRWCGISRLGRVAIATAATGAALFIAVSIAVLTLPAIGSVSSHALTYSLTREAEGDLLSTDLYRCEPRSGAVFRCEVGETEGGSGSATYRLQTRGRRCWNAIKTSPDSYEDFTPMAHRLAGCASLRDQVRLVERLLTLD